MTGRSSEPGRGRLRSDAGEAAVIRPSVYGRLRGRVFPWKRPVPTIASSGIAIGLPDTLPTKTTHPRRKLLVVANRAPVTYEDGVAKRGGGGLVTALTGLIAHHDVTWIASAMSDKERALAVQRGGSFEETTREGHTYRLRLVAHDSAAYQLFYSVVANPALWFVQHRLPLRPLGPEFRKAWDEGYVTVNEAFAAATLEELDREPEAAVLFHDYHLYLAPAVVRKARPDTVSSHFVHIPWPEPDAWAPLPAELTAVIHEGLLANDVVGFHTAGWRSAFLACVERFVPAGLGSTRVVAHPISVDPGEFERRAGDPAVLARAAEIEARRPEQLVVRVDRVDPSKNIVRGFEAFALLLERHPEVHGKVGFLALLAPSREDIAGVRGIRGADRGGGRRGERAFRARRLEAGRARHRR